MYTTEFCWETKVLFFLRVCFASDDADGKRRQDYPGVVRLFVSSKPPPTVIICQEQSAAWLRPGDTISISSPSPSLSSQTLSLSMVIAGPVIPLAVIYATRAGNGYLWYPPHPCRPDYYPTGQKLRLEKLQKTSGAPLLFRGLCQRVFNSWPIHVFYVAENARGGFVVSLGV